MSDLVDTRIGRIKKDWELKPLPDYIFYQEGPGLRKWQWTDHGMKVINVKNISADGHVDPSNTSRYISIEEFERRYAHFAIRNRDIVVASSGNTYGKVARINQAHLPMMMNTSVIRLHPATDALDPDFLYAFSRSPLFHNQIEAFVIGSAQPNFGPSHLKMMMIPVPDLTTQKKIAAVLSAYDALIDNNMRRIKILEELAQMIYREWFVNFRFPGHEKVKMVDSPLGLIPEGWKIDELSQHISVDKGISYQGKFLTESGKPLVNLKCIKPHGGFNRQGTKPYSGPFKDRHTVKPGDIVLANTDLTQAGNVIGSPAFVSGAYSATEILFSHHLFAVRAREKQGFERFFMYHLLACDNFRAYARGCASGTTVLGLGRDDVLNYQYAFPPKELRTHFDAIAGSLHKFIQNLYDQGETLCQTRDLLLPKLISGEVDVAELDIATEGLRS